MPTLIGALRAANARVITACAGPSHSTAVLSVWEVSVCLECLLNPDLLTPFTVRSERQTPSQSRLVCLSDRNLGSRMCLTQVTEQGALFTWGRALHPASDSPSGLGHADLKTKFVPTPITRPRRVQVSLE